MRWRVSRHCWALASESRGLLQRSPTVCCCCTRTCCFLCFRRMPVMRQYWRDFESLESWARSEPHRVWWQQFPSSVTCRRVNMWTPARVGHEDAKAHYNTKKSDRTTGEFAMPTVKAYDE